jgi:hypothetical protein
MSSEIAAQPRRQHPLHRLVPHAGDQARVLYTGFYMTARAQPRAVRQVVFPIPTATPTVLAPRSTPKALILDSSGKRRFGVLPHAAPRR